MSSISSKVSVLVTLYQKNYPDEVQRCFHSLAIQTYKPDEVILVIDGPISIDIGEILKDYADRFPVKILYQQHNIGLGKALNVGLKHCIYDYVARIDIDDVCKPNRLEIQKNFMDHNPGISILGGQVELFDNNGVYAIKSVPISSEAIERWSLFRNPINHSTVMFRRADVMKLGGYPEIRYTQDYILWISCLKSGLIFYNLPGVICGMFADKNMLVRRGLAYLKYDLKPYFMNHQLKRNGLVFLIAVIAARTLFNSINSFRSIFK
jgi:amylovoran biosynthesis glycosyltransferase AmsE